MYFSNYRNLIREVNTICVNALKSQHLRDDVRDDTTGLHVEIEIEAAQAVVNVGTTVVSVTVLAVVTTVVVASSDISPDLRKKDQRMIGFTQFQHSL